MTVNGGRTPLACAYSTATASTVGVAQNKENGAPSGTPQSLAWFDF